MEKRLLPSLKNTDERLMSFTYFKMEISVKDAHLSMTFFINNFTFIFHLMHMARPFIKKWEPRSHGITFFVYDPIKEPRPGKRL